MKEKKSVRLVKKGIVLFLVLLFFAVELICILSTVDFAFTPLLFGRTLFLCTSVFLLYFDDEIIRPVLKEEKRKWLIPLFLLSIFALIGDIVYEILRAGSFSSFFQEGWSSEFMILWFDEFLFLIFYLIKRILPKKKEQPIEPLSSSVTEEEK